MLYRFSSHSYFRSNLQQTKLFQNWSKDLWTFIRIFNWIAFYDHILWQFLCEVYCWFKSAFGIWKLVSMTFFFLEIDRNCKSEIAIVDSKENDLIVRHMLQHFSLNVLVKVCGLIFNFWVARHLLDDVSWVFK